MEIIKRLFGDERKSDLALPEDVQQRLGAWQGMMATSDSNALVPGRYVLLDVATDGLDPACHTVQSIAVLGLRQGVVATSDVLLIESLPEVARQGGYQLQRALLSVLEHIGHSPLVTWQSEFVGEFLQGVYANHLGLVYQPQWIDLAAVLPELFASEGPASNRFDDWLAYFGINLPGRLAALPDALGMARLLQVALVVARQRSLDTPQHLRQIKQQRRWLGRQP